jgi:hypothetical protein
MVSTGWSGGVARIPKTAECVRGPAFWAWTVSIGLHLTVLTAFGLVRFSRAEARDGHWPVPTAKISRIRKLTQAVPVIPKPKIKKPPPILHRSRFTEMTDKLSPVARIVEAAKPFLQDWPDTNLPGASGSADELSLSSAELSGTVEFFGSSVRQRKVCYLVDCSGSMLGVFGKVREELKDSIAALQPDQYFYVIFFGADKLFELGDGRLLRATPKAKSAANSLIDRIQPAGRTNAAAALERVVQIRDGKGMNPSIVYLLTDGFELTRENTTGFAQRIANLRKRFAPAVKINTIGFFPQDDDRRMLETIARQSGGEFVCITGGS